jgi:hypothetical protein
MRCGGVSARSTRIPISQRPLLNTFRHTHIIIIRHVHIVADFVRCAWQLGVQV